MYRFVVKRTYNKYIRKRKPTTPTDTVAVETPAKKENTKPVTIVKEETPVTPAPVIEENPVVEPKEITPKPKRRKKTTPKTEDK